MDREQLRAYFSPANDRPVMPAGSAALGDLAGQLEAGSTEEVTGQLRPDQLPVDPTPDPSPNSV